MHLHQLLCWHLNSKRLATADKEILPTNNQNKHGCKSCPETSRANSLLVQAKGGFSEQLRAYNERRKVNLQFYFRISFLFGSEHVFKWNNYHARSS